MVRIAGLTALGLQVAYAAFVLTAILVGPPGASMAGSAIMAAIALTFAATAFLLARGLVSRSGCERGNGGSPGPLADSGRSPLGRPVMVGAVAVGLAVGAAAAVAARHLPGSAARAASASPQPATDPAVEVGELVPDLASRLADGKPWRGADYRGRPLLLQFWTSWDDTSAGQMRRLRLLAAELGSDAPAIVGVCLDHEPDFPAALPAEMGITWPQVFEPETGRETSLATALGARVTPAAVWAIGSDGKLVGKDLRGVSLTTTVRKLVRDERMLRAPAPEIIATTLDGVPWQLSDHRGKVVVVDFWATWCTPCTAETPHLKELFARYRHRPDFAMVGVSLDREAGPPRAYCAAQGVTWPQLLEPGRQFDSAAARAYGVSSIPSLWVVDQAGQVVAIDVHRDALDQAVAAALAGPAGAVG